MGQTAADHLHHIGRPGDVNSKISRIEFVHDSFDALDRFFGILAFKKNKDVGGLAVTRYQQPAPKWTGQRILKTLRPCRDTFYRTDFIDCFDPSCEFLNSLEISR